MLYIAVKKMLELFTNAPGMNGLKKIELNENLTLFKIKKTIQIFERQQNLFTCRDSAGMDGAEQRKQDSRSGSLLRAASF